MAGRYQVEVTITSAKDLKNVNWRHGSLKPYAVAWVDPNAKSSTHVASDGDTSPTWDQTLLIPFDSPIEDSDKGKTLIKSAFEADTREADVQRACSGSRDGMAATNPQSRAGLGLAAEGTCPAGRRRHGPAAMSEQRRIGLLLAVAAGRKVLEAGGSRLTVAAECRSCAAVVVAVGQE
ncbi:hypothetical protein SASPL_126693 [Salvia splendens]|uniref:C2 domain-containing protein n=1 Tax=Salvia splendens TaxID=180675 RepID=A0A8X8XJG4_SALSN|nr:hypothetical protein SASPL_126693 [Salvia splendens]